MNRCIMSIILALGCGLLNGCNESYENLYESGELRKARDEAEIKRIRNQSEREDAEHKILLTAVERNVQVPLSPDTDITEHNYKAVDVLLKKLRVELAKDSPILVASLVNLDNLNESSTFGRVVSEQIASRFRQSGYTTIEMKLRTTVFMREGSGEFLLSRELSEIGIKHRAQAVVVGTYAAAASKVYLTVRVVNVSDSRILSSHDYTIPIGRDVFKMLLKGKANLDWL
ncbi:MAG TPA: FlgO family outer membrane protein [Sedimentisphaerales bacterium]|nr:FlgO family outer membrane protein [Sedimentisphaerales bacterium]